MAADSLYILLLLAMASSRSMFAGATWCVCRDGMGDAALQKTLDYACGAGADCSQTHQNGTCFNPNTVRAHCSHAVNSYFQRNRQAPGACDFSGTATIVTSDPSSAGCSYPSSLSGTSTTPVVTTPVNGRPNYASGSPLVTTPSNGILGGSNNGMGINNDVSSGRTLVSKRLSHLLASVVAISGLVFRWA